MENGTSNGAVYLQTNDASGNEIVAYGRRADGSLARIGDYETGGRGTGTPHLPSQRSVVLSDDERGYAEGPSTIPSAGQTPYGFDFTDGGALIVTEAFGGDNGKAAASSYAIAGPAELKPVSGSVGDGRSEVCWAAVTNDGRFVFVTNFGDCTISSYSIGEDGDIRLAEAVAASTRLGNAGIRDEAISSDGRFLY